MKLGDSTKVLFRSRLAVFFIVFVIVFLSATVLFAVHKNLDQIQDARLKDELKRAQTSIQSQLNNYLSSLVAVRALLTLEGERQPKDFKVFISGTGVFASYPGVTALGYIKNFDRLELPKVEASMRLKGNKNFHVWPKSNAKSQSAVIFLESAVPSSKHSIGFNMMSDPLRFHAMQLAARSGSAAVSQMLTLMPDPVGVSSPGIIMFLPFYGKQRAIPKTEKERLRNLAGFVYAPFRTQGFFESIFGEPNAGSELVNFEVTVEGSASKQPQRLYRRFSEKSKSLQPDGTDRWSRAVVLEFGHLRWKVQMSPRKTLLRPSELSLIYLSWLVVLGLIGLVCIIVWKAHVFLTEEEERKKNLESATQAKSYFLANMSHEIRTPLGAIVGFVDILTQDGISPRQRQETARNIQKNGVMLTRIIDDILDLSKIEAGKLHLDMRALYLPSIVAEIQSVMQIQAVKKPGLVFVVESDGPIPQKFFSDEVRVKQILMNLIGNALKFTEYGRVRLLIQTHSSGAMPELESSTIEFRIEDTGVGIALEQREQLFRAFSQADASTTRRFGGTGLGLALSQQLATLLGAKVELVSSEKNRGSVFRLLLPVGAVDNNRWLSSWKEGKDAGLPAQITGAPKLSLAGKRILLVEDTPDNQEIFQYFLETAGAKIDVVDNGVDAVERARLDQYDLILMDIQIPRLDGREATKLIRQGGYLGPIVALTAHAMVEEKESCLRAGCTGQITKPVTGEQLIRESADFLSA